MTVFQKNNINGVKQIFFHVRVPCPLHQKYIQGKEVLINIDNCQTPIIHQLNIIVLKNFAY